MFDKIIAYSVKNKFIIGLFMLALTIWGVYSLRQIPIDAVPDITNNQIQIITVSPTLATQEVEQFITTPIELSLQSLQKTEEIRSISRFGLSVITVVFQEDYDIYLARQLVSERLKEAQSNIPNGLGTPEMAPISTGLGEIYQYVVRPKKGFKEQYSASDLRTIQDWIVKRQLLGIEGVAEINSMGGYLKQYEVAIDPMVLKSMNLNITNIFDALEKSNENTGGAYIEKKPNTYYIRAKGIAKSLEDIGNIVIQKQNNTPILIKDVATVHFGKAPRYGALVRDGEEVVGGKVMMFKGANSAEVTELVKQRVIQIQKSLPEGVIVEPYLVRDKLISTAIGTVEKNLIEGGLIVIFILVLLLGNWRAGLIVASVIPFAMLFAISMMNLLGISANLMSLGAIDFGLIVDGAVIIVEAIVHRLQIKHAGKQLTKKMMNKEVITSSQKIRSSAAFGEIIILMVYIPILALVGIEGKMFKPMAQTVMLAIAGALILSLTYVPMMASLFLNKNITSKTTFADKLIDAVQKRYQPVLEKALKHQKKFMGGTIAVFLITLLVFTKMGGEFIPTLEEGDLAMQQILPPGSSLTQSIETAKRIQNKLMKEFPEIEDIVANIGSAEIPTDPMPVEIADYTLVMKPKKEWTSAENRQDLFEKIETSLQDIPGVGYEFSQPIQLRFNELMTGTKADIAIKLFGDDLDLLYNKAKESEKIIKQIPGVGTINVEQTIGMPQIIIEYQYSKLAQYGLHIQDVNKIIRTAFAGEKAGIIYEGEKRFDLVVRLNENSRAEIDDLQNLFISLDDGNQIPLSTIANIQLKDAPMQISRENTNRRIVIGVNVGDTDVETLVTQIQEKLDSELELPSGYYFTYGGQFENLKAANARLSVALPIALALIFILLYFTFGSFKQALLIFTAIPLSAIGGVWALQLRGMPFSISAGIGFIALFGVAVLNGIVLIGYLNQLKKEGMENVYDRILEGTKVRLRPVILTASVASLGFLPMALSTSGGAEVQRPLATVVIGGLISATFLTLVILPILYQWIESWQPKKLTSISKTTLIIFIFTGLGISSQAQEKSISLEDAVQIALKNHPKIKAGSLEVSKNESLQNVTYNLGNTSIGYKGDGLFVKNNQQVNQIEVSQNFNNIGISKANNRLQNEITQQSTLDQLLIISEVSYQVKQTFYQFQHQKKLQNMYAKLVKAYQKYSNIANARVNAGASNPMEAYTLSSKLKEYELLIKQLRLETENSKKQLQSFLNSEVAFCPNNNFKKATLEFNDSTQLVWLEKSKQNIAIAQAKMKVSKTQLNPSFSIGYAAQNYVQGGWLNGISGGISIPLFNNQTKRKIKAQELDVEIAKNKYKSDALVFNQEINKAKNQVLSYQQGVEFYESQVKNVNPEMIRIAELNYQAGEITYLELLNTLQIVSSNEQKYWNQLLAYNQAVAYYQFITNQQ
ncbi:CusA/CzcA family heavy metal efflux RND transporter [Wenyingzhuangia marina]|uniref:Cobalt-zinc-cadmium resistance protein CzcA n=1 Tax=Wenyingzhuangia marina TaxID=1195760 RepID=A0A1M5WR34_9FLAO|nr:CusA/CzcA family heavy metal efflux RND transporter [Wenyingzhuangia marina]GGF80111.1 acriflavine resistance protein B [Wenyingzhuangia marina]SHH89959.1 cobalt-zinc-cadmium resistance protein CzcA [Wenyingzhuangia marina]